MSLGTYFPTRIDPPDLFVQEKLLVELHFHEVGKAEIQKHCFSGTVPAFWNSILVEFSLTSSVSFWKLLKTKLFQ